MSNKIKVPVGQKILFTSDLHFFHKNIIQHCNRPFIDTNHMQDELIDRWNSKASDDDWVFVIGDFIFHQKGNIVEEILHALKGKKYLIIGNHDENKTINAKGWQATFDRLHLSIADTQEYIVLDHFPIESWYRMEKGSYHFHGHVHSMVGGNLFPSFIPRRIDVGVDYHNWYPMTFDELKSKLVTLETFYEQNYRKHD